MRFGAHVKRVNKPRITTTGSRELDFKIFVDGMWTECPSIISLNNASVIFQKGDVSAKHR
jgi:hypothetical protein